MLYDTHIDALYYILGVQTNKLPRFFIRSKSAVVVAKIRARNLCAKKRMALIEFLYCVFLHFVDIIAIFRSKLIICQVFMTYNAVI